MSLAQVVCSNFLVDIAASTRIGPGTERERTMSQIKTLIRYSFLALFPSLVFLPAPTVGITIRDDVPEANYIALASESKWAAAGVYTSSSTCSTSGGTLIHPEWAITAGHCANGTTDFVLGADRSIPDEQVSLDSSTRHIDFDGSNIANGNDLALSHLSAPILSVTPARLYRQAQEAFQTTTVIGYGRFGTGLTGDNQGGANIRRAGQNRIDGFGGLIGVSSQMIITDFDSPDGNDNTTGPATALDFESGIAFFDSGSGWFSDINGITYLVGVTSFRASSDGNANSDYGDVFGATRVSREMAWIDANHDVTKFWNQSSGTWNTSNRWLPGTEPTAVNAAVIDGGVANIVDAGAVAKYTFVAGYNNGTPSFGTLNLQNDFTSDFLIARDSGRIEVSRGNSPTIATRNLTGELWVEAEGTLAIALDAPFNVSGDAELAGTLEINTGQGAEPTTRGTTNDLVLMTAGSLIGTFDDIRFDGVTLTPGTQAYTGTNGDGEDGLFRTVTYNGNQIQVENYFALPGDANGDGNVDGQDFVIWNTNKFTLGNDWTDGDFDGDGIVNGQDFVIWNSAKFTSVDNRSNLLSVPEPTSGPLVFSALLLIALSVRRRATN